MMDLQKEEIYFSREANYKFASVSQVKQMKECEFGLIESLREPWTEDDESKAFRVGKYMHAWNEGNVKFLEFQQKNFPYIFKKTKDKYADYEQADKTIELLEKDDVIMEMINESTKEVAMTENIWVRDAFYPVKIRIDGINMDKKYFYDLKYLADKYNLYDSENRIYAPVLDVRGYLMQMAVYSMVLYKRLRQGYFNPFIILATKEKTPDIRLVQFARNDYELESFVVEHTKEFIESLPKLQKLKDGEIKPERCEHCKYCITRKETSHIFYMDFNWRSK